MNKDSDRQVPKFRALFCPVCSKPNILRPIDDQGNYEPLSKEMIEINGKKRFLDACPRCARRYLREDIALAQNKIQQVINTKPEDLSLA